MLKCLVFALISAISALAASPAHSLFEGNTTLPEITGTSYEQVVHNIFAVSSVPLPGGKIFGFFVWGCDQISKTTPLGHFILQFSNDRRKEYLDTYVFSNKTGEEIAFMHRGSYSKVFRVNELRCDHNDRCLFGNVLSNEIQCFVDQNGSFLLRKTTN